MALIPTGINRGKCIAARQTDIIFLQRYTIVVYKQALGNLFYRNRQLISQEMCHCIAGRVGSWAKSIEAHGLKCPP